MKCASTAHDLKKPAKPLVQVHFINKVLRSAGTNTCMLPGAARPACPKYTRVQRRCFGHVLQRTGTALYLLARAAHMLARHPPIQVRLASVSGTVSVAVNTAVSVPVSLRGHARSVLCTGPQYVFGWRRHRNWRHDKPSEIRAHSSRTVGL